MTLLLALSFAAAVAAFWYDSLGARECALKAGRHACERSEAQLLDQTVCLTRLGLARARDGRLRITRCYRFEFSLDGSDRWHGHIQMLGRWAHSVQLEHPEGLIILGRSAQAEHRPQSTG